MEASVRENKMKRIFMIVVKRKVRCVVRKSFKEK